MNVVAVHPEFVIDGKAHKKAVIVPFYEWQHLMEELAELEDIRAYDHAKARQEPAMPFEMAVQQIKTRIRK